MGVDRRRRDHLQLLTTHPARGTTDDATELGGRFARAVAAQDADGLKELLAPARELPSHDTRPVPGRATTPTRRRRGDPRNMVLAGPVDHRRPGGRLRPGRPGRPSRLPIPRRAARRRVPHRAAGLLQDGGRPDPWLRIMCSGFVACRLAKHDRRSTPGAPSTGTIRSRSSPRSARSARCTRSPWPTATTPGWWWVTTRPARRSTTRGSPRTCTPRSPSEVRSWPRASRGPNSPGTCSPSTHPTTPGCGVWCRRRSRCARSRVAAADPGHRGRSPRRTGRSRPRCSRRSRGRVRVPAAVHGDLRAARGARRRTGLAGSAGWWRCWCRRRRRPTTHGQGGIRRRGGAAALVAGQAEAPGDDLVSGLIAARDGDERLDDQELLSTIFQLIVAGHDTTTSLHRQRGRRPPRRPRQLERLRARSRADPGRGGGAAAVRRPGPPFHVPLRRRAGRARRQSIPAGAQVIVCIAAANRDPSRYTDPGRLDLERAEGRHLAFGHGIHHCLGAPLARLEGQLALRSLVRRFPRLRLACDA